MIVLTSQDIYQRSVPSELIEVLQKAFAEPFENPERMHCDLPGSDDAKLLIMPAWQSRDAMGVKIATVMPENGKSGLPTIDGIYALLDGKTGRPLAILEAPALTALRTAAVSALGSKLMSRDNSESLLVVGTGTLAPHIVRAHVAVRPLKRVRIWGRDYSKAAAVVRALSDVDCDVSVAGDLAQSSKQADIISCATSSPKPLIFNEWIEPGCHVDLIGSFTPSMQEADPFLFQRAKLVVDTCTALKESGDLIEPMERGFILDPAYELANVVQNRIMVRRNQSDITIFKSVGTGLSDIAAARYFLSKSTQSAEGSSL